MKSCFFARLISTAILSQQTTGEMTFAGRLLPADGGNLPQLGAAQRQWLSRARRRPIIAANRGQHVG